MYVCMYVCMYVADHSTWFFSALQIGIVFQVPSCCDKRSRSFRPYPRRHTFDKFFRKFDSFVRVCKTCHTTHTRHVSTLLSINERTVSSILIDVPKCHAKSKHLKNRISVSFGFFSHVTFSATVFPSSRNTATRTLYDLFLSVFLAGGDGQVDENTLPLLVHFTFPLQTTWWYSREFHSLHCWCTLLKFINNSWGKNKGNHSLN